jgi:hypothetical protein
MTGFNHGMTGAVIALTIKQPALAVPLAFISHFVCDAIPHFGFQLKDVLSRKFNLFHIGDFLLALILMIVFGLLFRRQIWLIWACMVAAASPDIAWWLNRRSVKSWPASLDRFSKWHFGISRHVRHLYFDAVWFALMWLVIIWIKLR